MAGDIDGWNRHARRMRDERDEARSALESSQREVATWKRIAEELELEMAKWRDCHPDTARLDWLIDSGLIDSGAGRLQPWNRDSVRAQIDAARNEHPERTPDATHFHVKRHRDGESE